MYKIRKNIWLWGLAVFLGGFIFSAPVKAERGASVAVIAPSNAARSAAQDALWNLGWTETKDFNLADAIVVACQSNENWPLNTTYGSIKELESDAFLPVNTIGSDTHIYIYKINADMSVDEIKYLHLPANGGNGFEFSY